MAEKVIRDLIEVINTHHINAIGSLLSDEHVYIDAAMNSSFNRADTIANWQKLFADFPDYSIEVEQLFNDGANTWVIFGSAEGTYKNIVQDDARWVTPASWKVVVTKNKVTLWQVYADTKLQEEIIAKYSANNLDAVQGFGGVFFKSENPTELCAWYDKQLGTQFAANTYSLFWWKDNGLKPASTTFGVFANDSKYFAPSEKPFMLNFRVNDLEATLKRLKKEGVKVFEAENYDYGKFGWILDLEGNKVELWQPEDETGQFGE